MKEMILPIIYLIIYGLIITAFAYIIECDPFIMFIYFVTTHYMYKQFSKFQRGRNERTKENNKSKNKYNVAKFL